LSAQSGGRGTSAPAACFSLTETATHRSGTVLSDPVATVETIFELAIE